MRVYTDGVFVRRERLLEKPAAGEKITTNDVDSTVLRLQLGCELQQRLGLVVSGIGLKSFILAS